MGRIVRHSVMWCVFLTACGGDGNGGGPEHDGVDHDTASSDAPGETDGAGPDGNDASTDAGAGNVVATLSGVRQLGDATTPVELLLTDASLGGSNKGVSDRRAMRGRVQVAPGGPEASITGWHDPVDGEFEFSFSADGSTIVCGGTLAGGVATGACPREGAAYGSFAAVDLSLDDVRGYCGQGQDQFSVNFGVGLLRAGDAAAFVIGTSGRIAAVAGAFSGASFSATSAVLSATGTLEGSTVAGTWTGLGLNGPWSAQEGACPAFEFDVVEDESDAGDADDATSDANDAGSDADASDTRLVYSAHERCPAGDPVDTTGHRSDLFSDSGFNCANVGDDRELRCWGSTTYSYMWLDGLDPPFNLRGNAVTLRAGGAPISDVTSIVLKDRVFCWSNGDGEAWCYGVNAAGELGIGVADDQFREQPVRVTALDRLAGGTAFVQAVYGGLGAQCARFDEGRFACWGAAASGILGGAPWETRDAMEAVEFLPEETIVDAAYTGAMCVVTAAGTVYCWGQNVNGIIANPAAPTAAGYQPTPMQVYIDARTPLTDVVAIQPALAGVCALRQDGSVVCWGNTWFRRDLGIPTIYADRTDEYMYVVPFTGYENGILCGVDAISSVGGHVCTLRGTEVWCFGADNRLGTLGTGLDVSGPDPVRAEIADVVEVQSLSGASCAHTSDGRVFCWGAGGNQQIPGVSASFLAVPSPITL